MDYQEWRKVIQDNFPEVVFHAEACMSAVAQLWFDDIELPTALVLVGNPATYKTTVLDFFAVLGFNKQSGGLEDLIFYTDKFTPQSFVSHKADVKDKKELEKIDLLPKIKNKVFIVPELAPIFTQTGDRLVESLGVLTRILDGKGFVSDSGAHGHRGYKGNFKFVWLAATTPISHHVWSCMGNLGTKIYFLRMNTVKPSIPEIVSLIKVRNYKNALAKCASATLEFINSLRKKHPVKWDKSKDDDELLGKISSLAVLLSRLRGAVNVSVSEEYDPLSGKIQKVNYTIPVIEHPVRAAIILYNYVRAYAWIKGRDHIENEDLKIAIEIALSSAPEDRVRAFDAIIKHGGKITASELEDEMGCSRHTALRAINTLEILNIVTKNEESFASGDGYARGYVARLNDDLKWFLADDFWKIRGVKPEPVKKQKKVEKTVLQLFDTREGGGDI